MTRRSSTRGLPRVSVGRCGDELVHTPLDLMYAQAPYTVIDRGMHIHPTVAAYLPTLIGNLKPLK